MGTRPMCSEWLCTGRLCMRRRDAAKPLGTQLDTQRQELAPPAPCQRAFCRPELVSTSKKSGASRCVVHAPLAA